jgi:hypothetical protein
MVPSYRWGVLSPLGHPGIELPYLESAWLDSTRNFLHHCSAQLIIPEIQLPELQRQHDACLMNGFLDLQPGRSTLKSLNRCRLWLRVTLLSDICSLTGDCIDRNVWLGLKPMPSSNNDWPVQSRPHDKAWSLWRKAISGSFCHNDRRYVLSSRPGQLRQPLGVWLHGATVKKSPRWQVYHAHSSQRLFLPSTSVPGQYHTYSTDTHLDFSLATYDICYMRHG